MYLSLLVTRQLNWNFVPASACRNHNHNHFGRPIQIALSAFQDKHSSHVHATSSTWRRRSLRLQRSRSQLSSFALIQSPARAPTSTTSSASSTRPFCGALQPTFRFENIILTLLVSVRQLKSFVTIEKQAMDIGPCRAVLKASGCTGKIPYRPGQLLQCRPRSQQKGSGAFIETEATAYLVSVE